MGFRLILNALILFLGVSCFANEPWTEQIPNRTLRSDIFVQKAEGILNEHHQTVLFAVQSEDRAAVFFTDYKLQNQGVLIFMQSSNGLVIGGNADFLKDEDKLKAQLRATLAKKYSKLELILPQAYADDCRLMMRAHPTQSLKAVSTEQNQLLFLDWAKGCGRGLLEGAEQGSTGSLKAILDLIKAAASVSGPSDALAKLKNIPNEIAKVIKEFKRRADEVFSGDLSIPPHAAGNLLCSFFAEYGTKAIITTVTAGAGSAGLVLGIKAFLEKTKKVLQAAKAAKRLNDLSAKVDPKFHGAINKIEDNFAISYAQFDEKNLNRHFKKHKEDIGASSTEDYAQKAQELAKATGNDVMTITGSRTGAIFKFKPSTNEFIVISKTGKIETFFKPNPEKHGLGNNLEYFLSQHEKY